MKILGLDFDGTFVEQKFPEIGRPLPGAVRTLQKLQAAGWLIVLNTCREDEPGGRAYLTEAVEYLKKCGIDVRSVNENRVEDDVRKVGPRRKVLATVYVDDRNLGGFPGWDVVARTLGVA